MSHGRSIDEVSGVIIDCALEIHKGLGPGLLESVYETVLATLLMERGFKVETQKVVSFEFRGIHFENGLCCDLLVNNLVVVELKSVERNIPVHQKQLQTYLRLMKKEVGLLINFGGATLKEGLQRVVNNFDGRDSSLKVNKDNSHG